MPPPDITARESILKLKLKGKPVENIDYGKLAKKLDHFSGADIEALIDIAIEEKLESSFEDGIPKPIKTKDLLNASKKHKPSTKEWFGNAKNFALFANDSGLYGRRHCRWTDISIARLGARIGEIVKHLHEFGGSRPGVGRDAVLG